MAFIKEESEDMKIEETFNVKHEDTEEQTNMIIIKEETEDMKTEEIFRVKQDTEERTECSSVQRALDLLGLIDGDNSDLDVSDYDDPILDGNYQPSPHEKSSSEDSSDDENPISEPTVHSIGCKHADSADNGSWTGTETGAGTGSCCTHRPRRQSQEIEAGSSVDDLEEPPGPSQTTKKKKGDSEQGHGLRWKATQLTPKLTEYQHQDKTDLDRHGWTPLDYLEHYIDRDLMMTIAECSNIMSLSKSGEPLNMTVDEVYHFFGACIFMSCIRYPTIRMYWSKALKITAITDKFTRSRFFKLREAIKVVIDHDVPEDLKMSDKFWKVRPFLDRILRGCLSLNRPDCASISEQMIPFTGACPCRQYLPMKPNPVGIKNFLCATADGIVLDFELYQGTGSLIEKVEEPEGLSLGNLVIERLCQTLHRGTKVYCNRFFTTIKGVQRMMDKELYMTGTITKNQLTEVKHKLPSDKAMKNAGRGTSSEVSAGDGKLCVVKWYDNKPVLLVSVVHGRQPEDTCQRWDKKKKQYVTVSRPSIIREYNSKMGGVDLMDRMISNYRMSTRTKKWTMRMVMHFTDLALANSWLLYRKDHAICAGPKTRPIQFLQFRMEVAMTLLAQHHSADADLSAQSEEEEHSNQGVKRHVTELPHVSVRRRANAHLPEIISLKNAMRCRQLGCTGRTRVRCMTCKVFLCLQTERNCFLAFHT
ncbi:piggyBac transposable element-derived protein 3 [Pimephales promelas]|uniref:piggyBac transposable element-derived protein 3 n=1 Tax=Pimephales promelas TaxID=90988 RepID=UPI001955A7EA|nr:piggyBac transposable element-derived protein 3 [Pimephales promelas]KAG1934670.1 piggyBac transposable element-derived protein 3-like [Pimephales promelas]KAG1934671.1 piggyBac transposable element-derived protein 3-like [Pimephales promelas]